MNSSTESHATVLETTPCGVCGSSNFTHLFDARDHIYGNPGTWPVAQCADCKVVYLNPRIPPTRIGAYYPQTYYTNRIQRRKNDSLRERTKFNLIRQCYGYPRPPGYDTMADLCTALVRFFVSRTATFQHNIYYVKDGRVLDVGCGSGWCLNNYQQLGWETHGTELGPESAQIAREAGHQIFLGELPNAQYPDNHFDAVTFWDALEHIHNPAEILREAFRVCRPGGRLYVYVPNYGSWYARRYRDTWFMFTAPLHYYHYTSETLSSLLSRVGFKSLEVRYPLGGVGLQPTWSAVSKDSPAIHRLISKGAGAQLLRMIDRLLPRGHLLVIGRKP